MCLTSHVCPPPPPRADATHCKSHRVHEGTLEELMCTTTASGDATARPLTPEQLRYIRCSWNPVRYGAAVIAAGSYHAFSWIMTRPDPSRPDPRIGSGGFQNVVGRARSGQEVVRTLTGRSGPDQEVFQSHGPVRVTLTRPDLTRPDPTRSDPIRPDPTQPDLIRPDPREVTRHVKTPEYERMRNCGLLHKQYSSILGGLSRSLGRRIPPPHTCYYCLCCANS